jgi:hypothetical protein
VLGKDSVQNHAERFFKNKKKWLVNQKATKVAINRSARSFKIVFVKKKGK